MTGRFLLFSVGAFLLSCADSFAAASPIELPNFRTSAEFATHEASGGTISISAQSSNDHPKFKFFPKSGTWDFSESKFVEFTLKNSGDKRMAFTLWALSGGGFSGATVETPEANCILEGGETKTFRVDLETRFAGEDALFDAVDRSKISSVEIVFNRRGPIIDAENKIYHNGMKMEILGVKLSGTPLRKVDKEGFSKRYATPEISEDPTPRADKRFFRTLPKYKDTQLRHIVYLPKGWVKGKKYPVIVEYTGNVFYYQKAYCYSTGFARQGNMACALSRGEFIAINLPFVAKGGTREQFDGWGDPDLTAQYCLDAMEDAFKNLGADPDKVAYTGFSRGEFAANYILLRNDGIAKIWKVFTKFDPSRSPASIWADGKSWNNAAEGWEERAKRLAGRPVIALSPRVISVHVDTQYNEDTPSTLKTLEGIRKIFNEN